MTWSLFRWVWRLEAPLFVGMSPAGVLNRCRLYVPARALWGAVTAETARLKSGEGFPNYKDVGDEVKRSCRFTYLFPAEKRDGRFLAWLPKFEKEKGLRWCLQNSDKSLSDRDFRKDRGGRGRRIDPAFIWMTVPAAAVFTVLPH